MSINCKCLNCGYENEIITKYILNLENENKELKIKLAAYTSKNVYIASAFREHFHRPSCEWVARMNPANMVVFYSHEDAVNAGYKPCKTCRA